MKIAIIGSRDLSSVFSMNKKFEDIVKLVDDKIGEMTANSPIVEKITLISGGSSWGDFVAVYLMKKYPERFILLLFLPAFFDETGFDVENKCGRILNDLHNEFKGQTGIDSIKEMNDVMEKNEDGTVFHEIVVAGFYARNNKIAAECDAVIAITTEGGDPATPGTSYTWKLCKGKPQVSIGLRPAFCQKESEETE